MTDLDLIAELLDPTTTNDEAARLSQRTARAIPAKERAQLLRRSIPGVVLGTDLLPPEQVPSGRRQTTGAA